MARTGRFDVDFKRYLEDNPLKYGGASPERAFLDFSARMLWEPSECGARLRELACLLILSLAKTRVMIGTGPTPEECMSPGLFDLMAQVCMSLPDQAEKCDCPECEGRWPDLPVAPGSDRTQ